VGIDIHLSIFKNKECIAEDIFDGRNSTWFNNIMGEGNDEVYDSLPLHYGISDETSEEWARFHEDPCSYFGRHYIKVKDFKDWFVDHRPDIDAGWATTYEKWVYENKGIEPVYLKKELNKDDVIEDMHFIVITNKYDCSAWLYNYLIDNNIPDNAVVQYCFDN
jgi:hypothetical protein